MVARAGVSGVTVANAGVSGVTVANAAMYSSTVANAVVYSGQCGQCRVCLRSAVPGPGARWYPSWPYTWMPPPYYRVPHHHPPLPGTPPLAEYGAHYASRPDKNVNFPKMGAKWVLQKTTVGVGSAPLLLSQ